ncbi:MAG: hypothetical protein MZV65_06925 [Chromatiales bacterium]|nr:hypothetical protein [Chromatiales bacterium]
MRYVTSFERIGIRKGMEKGMARGLESERRALLRLARLDAALGDDTE